MSDIKELQVIFNSLKAECKTPVMFDFGKKLMDSCEPGYLDFHYSLLTDLDVEQELYNFICRKFKDRGRVGENYLLEKIATEKDDTLKGSVLQILGSFKYANGKRSNDTASIARQCVNSQSEALRGRALMVLGWAGNAVDAGLIAASLFNDSNSENRSMAASSLMQIFFNDKSIAPLALAYLKKALETETDPAALYGILISVQEISGKKLGLKHSPEQFQDKNKMESALKKAKNILSKMEFHS